MTPPGRPAAPAATRSSAALQTDWARSIIRGLRTGGVTDLVISPGSRSTPLVLASADALRRHLVIDERSAAFFALGLARESRSPVAMLCTSGSAGGHYLPALMEAFESGVPLIAITADRPLRLLGRGANQTTDQRELFGRFADPAIDLGDPIERRLQGLEGEIATCVRTAGESGRPAHLNVRFDKPLEPDAAPAPAAPGGAGAIRPAVVPSRSPARSAVAAAAERIAGCERVLVVCGPAGPAARAAREPLGRLSARFGLPVYAEACSQLRFGTAAEHPADGHAWLMGGAAYRPELVVQIGAAPVLGALPDAPVVALCERGTPDPFGRVERLVHGHLGDTLDALCDHLGSRAPSRYTLALEERSRAVWAVMAGAATPRMTEPEAVRIAVRATPADALLHLGNSLPVRTVDRFVPASACAADVASQRGLSGIDGAVAQCIGAACTERTVVAVMGDMSFRHDLASLGLAAAVETPVVLVVIDNDGGRIFESLPVADHPAGKRELRPFYVTPPGPDIAGLAAAFGVPTVQPRTLEELSRAITDACEEPGLSVVHTRVEPSSALASRRHVEEALRAAGIDGGTEA